MRDLPRECGPEIHVDVEHVHHRPAQLHGVTEIHHQLAAWDPHDDVVADQPSPVRDCGRCACSGAAAQRLPHSSFPDPHGDFVLASDLDEFHVGQFREANVVLEVRTVLGDARAGGIVNEHHEVRIPHSGRIPLICDAVKLGREPERAGRIERDGGRVEGDRTHVDGGGDHLAGVAERVRDLAAATVGVDHEPTAVAAAVAHCHRSEAADAVAAHLGHAAVGVEQGHAHIGAVSTPRDDHEPVGADAPVAVAQRSGNLTGDAQRAGVTIEE